MKKSDTDFFESSNLERLGKIGDAPEEANDTDAVKSRLDVDASEIKFKRTTFGFEPREVLAYIAQNNEMYMSACKTYDKKISDYKEKLAFLTRERESLVGRLEVEKAESAKIREELEELKATLAPEAAQIEFEEGDEQTEGFDIDVYVNPVDSFETVQSDSFASQQLQSENTELVAHIATLRQSNIEAQETVRRLTETLSDYEQVKQRRTELEDKTAELTSACADKDMQIIALTQIQASYETLCGEHEMLEKKCETITQEKKEALSSLTAKTQELNVSYADNEQLRKTISEYDIRQSVLRTQLKKADEDLTQLREESRQRTYESESRLSELETEYSKNKIELHKQLQVHKYHVEQAQTVLEELKKQLDEVKSSASQMIS